jgi:hypothetical protein
LYFITLQLQAVMQSPVHGTPLLLLLLLLVVLLLTYAAIDRWVALESS